METKEGNINELKQICVWTVGEKKVKTKIKSPKIQEGHAAVGQKTKINSTFLLLEFQKELKAETYMFKKLSKSQVV